MNFEWTLETVVGATYLGTNFLGIIILSVVGAIYVRNLRKSKQEVDAHATEAVVVAGGKARSPDEVSPAEQTASTLTTTNRTTSATITTTATAKNEKSFLSLWAKTVWKMRSVYGSFIVHCFDIFTDLLAIIQWWNEEKAGDIDNVDSRLMAQMSIVAIVIHKCVSSYAIWTMDGDARRAIFQFFDLLIFEEIYSAHKKIFGKNSNNNVDLDNSSIESTMSFKYIRSMEAIFESTPQSVLQLTYVMRRGQITFKNNDSLIFIISICQSVISMTNAVLKDDNSRGMYGSYWKSYKKRLPPSMNFLKHAISRLAQVINRVTILALFWTVCGGLPFGILCSFELLSIILQLLYATPLCNDEGQFNSSIVLLYLNNIILLPPELMFSEEIEDELLLGPFADRSDTCFSLVGCICSNTWCCLGIGTILSWLGSVCCACDKDVDLYMWPVARIGISFAEMVTILIFGIIAQNDNNDEDKYLFSWQHSLSISLVCIFTFIITLSQHVLFPDFSMPDKINPRSKWGYAFAGELTQLQRINEKVSNNSTFWDELTPKQQEAKHQKNKYKRLTCATLALANKHMDVVEWLEENGATLHKRFRNDVQKARKEIRECNPGFKAWID